MVGFQPLSPSSHSPSGLRELSIEQQERLTQVLDQYMVALEDGVPLSPEQLCHQHPDLADSIRQYCQSLDELHSIAAIQDDPNDKPQTSVVDDERRLGDFLLVREIGHGGMGVVYEAKQISLGRRVAVKILPFASVLDPKQLARFKTEAQAAASVQHPNIVPVYSVGSERGVHYYAMQFISGVSLDKVIHSLRSERDPDYRDGSRKGAGRKGAEKKGAEKKGAGHPVSLSQSSDPTSSVLPNSVLPTSGLPTSGLPTSVIDSVISSIVAPAAEDAKIQVLQRHCRDLNNILQIGIQAAEALHSAHEIGILHRDIKPSNLLLDENRKLWVTDFGLARMQKDAALTQTGDVVGTRSYMSPEQAMGMNALVDQRTDIYALGLTLYELLTLSPAISDNGGLVGSAGRYSSPISRRTGNRIPFDVETILLRATAENREDRYLSGQDFADDLRRVLTGVPILAKRPTYLQRFASSVRRNLQLVLGFGLVAITAIVALCAGLIYLSQQKSRAENNLETANRRFREAREMVDRFGARLATSPDQTSDRNSIRNDLLNDTLTYYLDSIAEVRDRPGLTPEVALTTLKAAQLSSEIGALEQSAAHYRSAIKLFEQLVSSDSTETENHRNLSRSQNNLGLVLMRLGRLVEAAAVLTKSVDGQESVSKHTREASDLADVAQYRANLGLALAQLNQHVDAQSAYRGAIQILEQLTEQHSDHAGYAHRLAATYNNLAGLCTPDQPWESVRYYQLASDYLARSIASTAQSAGTATEDRSEQVVSLTKRQADLAKTYNNLGALRSRLNERPEAVAAYRQAISIYETLRDQQPGDVAHPCDLAVTLSNCGVVLTRMRDWNAAEVMIRRSVDLLSALTQTHRRDPNIHSNLGGAFNNLGSLFEASGDRVQALPAFEHAIKHQNAAIQLSPDVAQYREFVALHYFNAVRVTRHQGEYPRAVQLLREFLDQEKVPAQHLIAIATECLRISRAIGVAENDRPLSAECHELAVRALESAFAAGWRDVSLLIGDSILADLRSHPRFAELVARFSELPGSPNRSK